MPSLPLTHPLELPSTLMGGQSFCWSQQQEGVFSGWIRGHPTEVRLSENGLCWGNSAIPPDDIRRYFCFDVNLHDSFGISDGDPWLAQAFRTHPGLRPVREDPWECLVNFLCSSLKQIVQIQQINARLRTHFGGAEKSFPSASTLAAAGEKALRACALGYRAKHVAETAKRISSDPDWLTIPSSLTTTLAAQHLEQLPGVGPKISRCVLLYAYSRWDAFPVDVWVDRLIRELYFPRRRKPFRAEELEKWSRKKFGPTRGLAQLHLFHWFRTRPDARRRGASRR